MPSNWKIIDRNGSEIELPYTSVKPISKSELYPNSHGFVDGLAIIDNGKNMVVLTTGMQVLFKEGYERIFPFNEGCALALKDDAWYILKQDSSVQAIQDKMLKPIAISGGLIRVIEKKAGNSECGFIDLNGEIVIPPQFEDAADFNGCGAAWARSGANHDSIGIINRSGQWVLQPKLAMVLEFDEEAKATIGTMTDAFFMHNRALPFYKFNHQGQYTIVKANGEVIPMPDSVQRLFKFSNGLAMFRLEGKYGKIGYVNNMGEIVIAPNYDEGRDYEDGFAIVEVGGKWGIVDRRGSELVPFEYAEIKPSRDGFALLEKKNLFGFYNAKEDILIEAKYTAVKHFKDGYAAVLDPKTRLWGLIDSKGAWAIEPQFTQLYFASEVE